MSFRSTGASTEISAVSGTPKASNHTSLTSMSSARRRSADAPTVATCLRMRSASAPSRPGSCFAFVRMDADLAAVPAEVIALGQAVQAILLWSDTAFTDRPALAQAGDGTTILRPGIAGVIRAAYDPVLPVMARDPAHALRLSARMGALS